MRTLQYRTRFIELASEVNAEMPRYLVSRVAQALNEHEKPVKGSRVLLLGVAYKANVGDVRESPALDIIELLRSDGAIVTYHDPFVPSIKLDSYNLRSKPLTEDLLRGNDIVVITTDHQNVSYDLVLEHASIVLDSRNGLRGKKGHAVVYPIAGPPTGGTGAGLVTTEDSELSTA